MHFMATVCPVSIEVALKTYENVPSPFSTPACTGAFSTLILLYLYLLYLNYLSSSYHTPAIHISLVPSHSSPPTTPFPSKILHSHLPVLFFMKILIFEFYKDLTNIILISYGPAPLQSFIFSFEGLFLKRVITYIKKVHLKKRCWQYSSLPAKRIHLCR